MTKRYGKTTLKEVKKNLAADDNPEDLRKEFPDSLVKAFVKLKLSDFSDKEHAKYVALAAEFLGKNKDAIEYMQLVVKLARATTDLTETNEKKQKAKTRKSKKS